MYIPFVCLSAKREITMLQEFKDFIARGNVMDMAVGIIMGAAFTGIVKSLVDNVIMPFIGVFTNGIDFSKKFIALNGIHYDTLVAAQKASAPVITYGVFVNAVINFLIVAFVVFLLVKAVNRIKDTAIKKQVTDTTPPQTPEDIMLLQEIRDLLKK
jgi:large conductance mechanosensitive channel